VQNLNICRGAPQILARSLDEYRAFGSSLLQPQFRRRFRNGLPYLYQNGWLATYGQAEGLCRGRERSAAGTRRGATSM